MKSIVDQFGGKYVHLTQTEWIEVCDKVDLDTAICTMEGRFDSLIKLAKEIYGPGWYTPPEGVNFRLRKRQRKIGTINFNALNRGL